MEKFAYPPIGACLFFSGLWGVRRTPELKRIEECGSCGCFHRPDFYGDCREDSERFLDAEDYAERNKIADVGEVEVVYLED